MRSWLQTLVAVPVAIGAVLAGCNPYERGLKESLRKSGEQNRTLAMGVMIMDGVKAWSAAHGGRLPNPQQFHSEVRPVFRKTDFGIAEGDLQTAFRSSQWSFTGGPVPAGADELKVGQLAIDELGGVDFFANGDVRKGYRSNLRGNG